MDPTSIWCHSAGSTVRPPTRLLAVDSLRGMECRGTGERGVRGSRLLPQWQERRQRGEGRHRQGRLGRALADLGQAFLRSCRTSPCRPWRCRPWLLRLAALHPARSWQVEVWQERWQAWRRAASPRSASWSTCRPWPRRTSLLPRFPSSRRRPWRRPSLALALTDHRSRPWLIELAKREGHKDIVVGSPPRTAAGDRRRSVRWIAFAVAKTTRGSPCCARSASSAGAHPPGGTRSAGLVPAAASLTTA